MEKGWIKLHRELLDKPVWTLSSPEQKCILIALMLMANHEEKEWEWMGKRYTCGPGQVITSLEKISQTAGKGVSIQNVRTALSRFEKYEFLTNESTNKNRLITICNWERYQLTETETNIEANKQLTSNQQATNKQLTTNKNDKNDKNNIIEKIKQKEIDLQEQIKPFIEKYGRDVCNNFYAYWSEPNKSRTKLRYEMEKTWDVSRRLTTWANNDKNFNRNSNEER